MSEQHMNKTTRSTFAESFQLPLVQHLLLFLVVLCVFVPTFWYTYVWDDWNAFALNKSIRNWSSIPDYFTDASTFQNDPGDKQRNEYRPFRNIYYLITYKMHDLRPAGWHFNHVLIHCLASVLVLAFFHRLYRYAMAWPADRVLPVPVQLATWFAVAAWAVHPANTEVTAWLKSADDVLAVILVMCAMLLLFPKQGLLTWKRAIWAAVIIAVAFLTKESIAPIPLIYAVLAFWLAPDRRGLLRHKPFWGAVGLLFIDLFLYLIIRKIMLGKLEQVPYLAGSFSLMMATMTTAAVRYLQLTFWPFWPTVQMGDYSAWPLAHSWGNANVIAATALLACICCAVILVSRRSKVFAAGTVFLLLAFTPVSNLIPMMQVMAERFMYFPLIGIALAMASVYKLLLQRRLIAALPAIYITGALIYQTEARLPVWVDEQNFQEASAKALANNFRSQYNYGLALYRNGKTTTALTQFYNVAEATHDAQSVLLVARILAEDNKFSSAGDYLSKHRRWNLKNASYLAVNADMFRITDETTNALSLYAESLKLNPDSALVWLMKARVEKKINKTTEALHDLNRAKSLEARLSTVTLENLGM